MVGMCFKSVKSLAAVIPIDNDTDDNGNEWETVGAKRKQRIG